jgi:hypothetical protein
VTNRRFDFPFRCSSGRTAASNCSAVNGSLKVGTFAGSPGGVAKVSSFLM